MTDGGVFGWERRWEGTERRKGGGVQSGYITKGKNQFSLKKKER